MGAFKFDQHEFKVPVKKIDTPAILEVFKNSKACKDLVEFISNLQGSVQSKKMRDTQITDVVPSDNIVGVEADLLVVGDHGRLD